MGLDLSEGKESSKKEGGKTITLLILTHRGGRGQGVGTHTKK